MAEKRVVIAGAGHAAGQAVATLRQKKWPGEIVLVGEEPWLPYQRPPLSKKFLAGEMPAERLYVKPPAFYEDPSITLKLETRVDGIDRSAKSLLLESGDRLGYDLLILALGARARQLPPLPGGDLAGIHYLRNVRDVQQIQQGLVEGRHLVIIGAGYIGLEVAAVASGLGLEVTVVEMQERVMKRVVAPPVSAFYEREHREHGVELRLQSGLAGFSGQEQVDGVILADGSVLPANLVVIGIGIVPNTEVGAAAGLEVSDGIVVDERCRTSDEHIYAIGDCTMHPNRLLGRSVRLESVQNALEQARTAACNICGEDSQYAEIPWFWSDQYDLKLQIAGLSQGYNKAVVRGDPGKRSFSCVYLSGSRILAVDAVNNPKDFLQSKKLIADRATMDLERLGDSGIDLKDLAG
jgi:3-phenylpropionate/trans-cinnamate dioxygenase ferredoxin reductase component